LNRSSSSTETEEEEDAEGKRKGGLGAADPEDGGEGGGAPGVLCVESKRERDDEFTFH